MFLYIISLYDLKLYVGMSQAQTDLNVRKPSQAMRTTTE